MRAIRVLIAALCLLPLTGVAGAQTLAERTSHMVRHDGFVPYFWDAQKGRLLLEISRFGEHFLYGMGVSSGAGVVDTYLDRNQLGDLGVFRFDRSGPRVLLVQLQTNHRIGSSDEAQRRAVDESFPSAVQASLPIVTDEGHRVLVDATEFLLKDTYIALLLKRAHQGEFQQDRSRSAIALERSGAFPRNTEIEATLTFYSDDPGRAIRQVLPDEHTLSLRVHHTFLKLPEPGYRPRKADPRVGYIPITYKDHGVPASASLEQSIITRWRLRAKGDALPAEPVQPLVLYLDRAIPEPERSAVRAGILWWNAAFIDAGIRNAIVVRDLPEGASFLDARYSGVSWLHRSDRGFSHGDFQADPRTGEILHAVVRLDAYRRRTTSKIWQNLLHPRAAPIEGGCTAGDAPDVSVLAGGLGADERRLVLARLTYLVAHEVGHVLGLGHNLAGSQSGWGSVMDYLPPNIRVRGNDLDLSDVYPRGIGVHDRLAIRWGYSPDDARDLLEQIAREAGSLPGVCSCSGDPRWAEYDLGPDPLAWLHATQEVRRLMLDRFSAGQALPGQLPGLLHERFALAYLYHRFAIGSVQGLIGGQYQSTQGSMALASWVAPARQREALDALLGLLEPDQLDVPDRISLALQAPPSSKDSVNPEAGAVFSPLAAARALGWLIIGPLLDAERAARLTLNQHQQALDLPELLRRLVGTAFAPSRADGGPRPQAIRRVVQRVVLDALIGLYRNQGSTPEVRAAVFHELQTLRRDLSGRRSPDPMAEAHLRLCEHDLTVLLGTTQPVRPEAPEHPIPRGRPL